MITELVATVSLSSAPAAVPDRAPACHQPVFDRTGIVRRYAPVLRFGPGETFFPIHPFFPAFIGRDSSRALSAELLAPTRPIAPGRLHGIGAPPVMTTPVPRSTLARDIQRDTVLDGISLVRQYLDAVGSGGPAGTLRRFKAVSDVLSRLENLRRAAAQVGVDVRSRDQHRQELRIYLEQARQRRATAQAARLVVDSLRARLADTSIAVTAEVATEYRSRIRTLEDAARRDLAQATINDDAARRAGALVAHDSARVDSSTFAAIAEARALALAPGPPESKWELLIDALGDRTLVDYLLDHDAQLMRIRTDRGDSPAFSPSRTIDDHRAAIDRWIDRVRAARDGLRKSLRSSVVAPRYSAVFYRARVLCPGETRDFWRLLFKDGQLAARTSLREVYQPGDANAIIEIDYTLYYFNDNGLTGHPEDNERVHVYVPADARRRDSLLVIIGAGHSPVTPNNVLVRVGNVANDTVNILVEVGGHSNAPDLAPYGAFQRGHDVNWRARDALWGTRDLQAVDGSSYLGDYRPEFTLPRDSFATVTLLPYDSTRRFDGGLSNGDSLPPSLGRYLLLDSGIWSRLVAEAESLTASRRDSGADSRRDSTRAQAFRDAFEAAWAETRLWHGAASPLGASDLREVAAGILRWSRRMITPRTQVAVARANSTTWDPLVNPDHLGLSPGIKHNPWGVEPLPPQRSFKGYVYDSNTCRPPGDGPRFLGVVRSTVSHLQAGIQFLPTGLLTMGLKLPSLCSGKLSFPGSLEIEARFPLDVLRDARYFAVSVTFERNYFALLSWYGGVRQERENRVSSFRPLLGVTLRPGVAALATGNGGFGNNLLRYARLRTGLSFGNVGRAVAWEMGATLGIP